MDLGIKQQELLTLQRDNQTWMCLFDEWKQFHPRSSQRHQSQIQLSLDPVLNLAANVQGVLRTEEHVELHKGWAFHSIHTVGNSAGQIVKVLQQTHVKKSKR